MTSFRREKLSGIIFLAVVYFFTAKFGLSIEAVSRFATLVWAPTGISLAILFIFGIDLWPGVFIGAFSINLLTGASLPLALAIALGNTLEALVGVFLLKKFNFDPAIKRLRDAICLIFLTAILSTLISSIIGVISLLVSGVANIHHLPHTWFTWWLGDMMGDLVIAPLIFVWCHRNRYSLKLQQLPELVLLLSLLTAFSLIVFQEYLKFDTRAMPIGYIIVPILAWIAVRFEQIELVCAIFLFAAIAIWGTISNLGPFARGDLNLGLALLQGYIAVYLTTFMVLSAVVSERKELENKKDNFVNVASHELKTPISTVKAYVQILGQKRSPDKRLNQYLPRIDSEIDRLIKLINDLLDFNRIGLNKLELQSEPFCINDLIKKTVTDLNYLDKQHTVTYKEQGEIVIVADKYRINQVLINLLNNALKFSPNNKKIEVKLVKNNGFVEVRIKDHGVGIALKYQQEIFSRFYQTDNQRKDHLSGLGLGLYISNEIIKQHGGQMWVKSREGRGSTFFFTLPLKA